MDRKNEKSLSTKNDTPKTLTVEDLAAVVGGALSGEDKTLGKYNETKYTQREGRSPAVIDAALSDMVLSVNL